MKYKYNSIWKLLLYTAALLILVSMVSQLSGIVAAQNTTTSNSSKVPVVVLFGTNISQSSEVGAVASVDGEITHQFQIITGVAALVPPERIQELKNKPNVIAVDMDVEVRAMDASANTQIFADQVWPLGFNGSGVRLAILDTGIATAHPEFAGRIAECKTEVAGTTTCEDDHGHGTHVAGIAGANGSNPDAKGVAPSVTLMSDKVLNSQGSGSISQIIAGIEWAVANKASVVSMSLGTDPIDGGGSQPNCDNAFPTWTTAINNAVAAGVTIVAAAGNSGTYGLSAPGCISSVIAAGAVDNTDTLADFSSVGTAMKDHGVVAPGVNIYSASLGGGYTYLSGTSMATPMVSGIIALLLSKDPKLSPSSIRGAIFNTADCVWSSCSNNNVGYGRINALKALNISQDTTPPTTTIAPPNGENSWYKTNTIYLTARDNLFGVKYTNYTVDGDAWKTNKGSGLTLITPVFVTNGNHSLRYYSVDNIGNVENVNIANIKVDAIPPSVYPLYSYDATSGIQNVIASEVKNAIIKIDPFTPGSNTVTYTRQKIDASKPASYRITTKDMAGFVTSACPVFLTLTSKPGRPVTHQFTIPSNETHFEINNSGIVSILFTINSNRLQLIAHPNKRDKQGNKYYIPEYGIYNINISEYLVPGNNNITLEARGKTGGSAEISIYE